MCPNHQASTLTCLLCCACFPNQGLGGGQLKAVCAVKFAGRLFSFCVFVMTVDPELALNLNFAGSFSLGIGLGCRIHDLASYLLAASQCTSKTLSSSLNSV